MLAGGYDFQINGVDYRAAEDAEGNHYVLRAEPLRPPNSTVVQGESTQKFNVRPDILLWNLTDWSGGEGQTKFDQAAPNRWRELEGVRVFTAPGTLRPGYFIEETKDSGGSSALNVMGQLAIGDGKLALLDQQDENVYVWDTTKWSAVTALTGPTQPVGIGQAAGDYDNVYWSTNGTDDVFYWPFTGTTATLLDSAALADSTWELQSLGPYVYAFSYVLGEVWEIHKGGLTPTLIDEFDSGSLGGIVAMGGKIYIFTIPNGRDTVIREIVPSSAAGTGFGSEIASFPGFRCMAMWTHSGLLFMYGWPGTDSSNAAVMYLDVNGTYGSLGRMRSGVFLGNSGHSEFNESMLTHYIGVSSGTGVGQTTRIFEIDAVSGGFACIAYNTSPYLDSPQSLAVFGGDIFFSGQIVGPAYRTLRARQDQYTVSSYAISPWHDFDLSDKKVLTSLVLSCEALPANWTVYVDYAIDGSASWTNAITYSTTGGKGTSAAVSTDSSTIEFRSLSVRVRMVFGGSGAPTTAPVVRGVESRATVIQHVKTWQLLVDLSDDKSGNQGHAGSRKTINLKTAVDAQAVVDFKDGYANQTPGVFSQHDVIIDSCTILGSTPGEGFAEVVLREIS